MDSIWKERKRKGAKEWREGGGAGGVTEPERERSWSMLSMALACGSEVVRVSDLLSFVFVWFVAVRFAASFKLAAIAESVIAACVVTCSLWVLVLLTRI